MEKDYSLLRQFDLEAAKRGDFVQTTGDDERGRFIADNDSEIVIDFERAGFVIYEEDIMCQLRMAPLCWVEGKPVYKGDVLWIRGIVGEWAKHYVDRYDAENCELWQDEDRDDSNTGSAEICELTWTPPKMKREAWVNIYKNSNNAYRHDTKEKADTGARIMNGTIDPNRVACVRIEWEE